MSFHLAGGRAITKTLELVRLVIRILITAIGRLVQGIDQIISAYLIITRAIQGYIVLHIIFAGHYLIKIIGSLGWILQQAIPDVEATLGC